MNPAAPKKARGRKTSKDLRRNTDYADATRRHWDDGLFLLEDSRLANADHLFGLAFHALKAVMLPLGMKLRPSGAPEDKRHGHIDRLWDEFGAFVSSRGGARYGALLSAYQNPFAGSWRVDQRYDSRSGFSWQRWRHIGTAPKPRSAAWMRRYWMESLHDEHSEHRASASAGKTALGSRLEALGTALGNEIVLVRDLRGRIRPVLPTKRKGPVLDKYRVDLSTQLGELRIRCRTFQALQG